MSDQGQVGYDITTSVIGEAKSAKSKGRKYKWHKQLQPLAKSMQVSKTKTQSLQSVGPREPLIQCCLFSTYQSPRNTKLLGYKLLQFIANSSYGDVYKSSKKSVGELSASKAMAKCRKTAQMVAHLHDCSILHSMHRDSKPSNILVKRQPPASGQPLAADQAPEQPMTPQMVTVYYRANAASAVGKREHLPSAKF